MRHELETFFGNILGDGNTKDTWCSTVSTTRILRGLRCDQGPFI